MPGAEAFTTFVAEDVNIVIAQVTTPGASPDFVAPLQAAAQPLVGSSYRDDIVRDLAETKLRDVYLKKGYLKAQIAPLQLQVDLAMTRVGAISAQAYMFGPGSKLNALMQGSDPAQFVDELTTLDQIARREAATVSDVAKLRDQYEVQKKPLDDALATLQQQNDDLSAQKTTIEAKIKQLDSMRLAAYGNGQGTGSRRPVTCPQVYTGDRGSRAAQFACQQIGKRYVWAADGPNTYDCSGLTEAGWRSVGVSLPHNALEQKYATPRVAVGGLRPGDLVFYYGDVHHVVIYVGNGWVVSAPTFGIPVEMQKIDMSRYNSAGRPG